MATITALSRNGIRQPQVRNATVEVRAGVVVARATAPAGGTRRWPAGNRRAHRVAATSPPRPACPGFAVSVASSAAPLHSPPKREALAEAHHREQCGGQQTDLVIGRQQADEERRDAHDEQRCHQGGLATDAITEVSEQDRPERARDEREPERGQRRQQCGGRIALGEEQVREHRDRRGGVGVEVVELDGGADHRGDDDATAGHAVDQIGCGCGHG